MTRSARVLAGVLLPVVSACSGRAPLPPDAGYSIRIDDATGWAVHELRIGAGTPRRLTLRVVPEAGANASSLTFNEVELLHQPPALADLAGFDYGIAVLYPTPGRVRDARFGFEERRFQLPKNMGRHHIHGLVCDVPWRAGEIEVLSNALRLPCVLDIKPGHPLYEIFPFRHRVEVAYTVMPEGVGIDFLVKNLDTRRLPLGFGILPHFRILGEREAVYLTVPARRHMAAGRFDRLPTGKLRELDGTPQDLRSPAPLSQLDLDDVYWGVVSDRPARYEERDWGLAVTLETSEIFTHLAVSTPRDEDYFTLAAQTSSADAHNLYAQGETEAAHLLILEPLGSRGSTVEGTIFLRVDRLEPDARPLALHQSTTDPSSGW